MKKLQYGIEEHAGTDIVFVVDTTTSFACKAFYGPTRLKDAKAWAKACNDEMKEEE